MGKVAFDKYYEQLTDEQLALILSDRKDLVPDAIAALDREVQRRHLRPPARPNWTPGPDSDEDMHSLEDSCGYQRLLKKKRFMDRFWYWLTLVPLILLIFPERYAYRDPESVSSRGCHQIGYMQGGDQSVVLHYGSASLRVTG